MNAKKQGQIAVAYTDLQTKNQARAVRADRFSTGKSVIFSVLSIILAILVIFNLYKSAIGRPEVTFTGTLEWLSSFNVGFSIPNLNACINTFVINKKWDILDGLRRFLNLFGTICGVGYYLVLNLVYTITFAGQFIYFILG